MGNGRNSMALPRSNGSEMSCDLVVPKCISMWKNKKGYLIPINTRLHSSTRDSVVVNVNKFREFNEALDNAEEKFNAK